MPESHPPASSLPVLKKQRLGGPPTGPGGDGGGGGGGNGFVIPRRTPPPAVSSAPFKPTAVAPLHSVAGRAPPSQAVTRPIAPAVQRRLAPVPGVTGALKPTGPVAAAATSSGFPLKRGTSTSTRSISGTGPTPSPVSRRQMAPAGKIIIPGGSRAMGPIGGSPGRPSIVPNLKANSVPIVHPIVPPRAPPRAPLVPTPSSSRPPIPIPKRPGAAPPPSDSSPFSFRNMSTASVPVSKMGSKIVPPGPNRPVAAIPGVPARVSLGGAPAIPVGPRPTNGPSRIIVPGTSKAKSQLAPPKQSGKAKPSALTGQAKGLQGRTQPVVRGKALATAFTRQGLVSRPTAAAVARAGFVGRTGRGALASSIAANRLSQVKMPMGMSVRRPPIRGRAMPMRGRGFPGRRPSYFGDPYWMDEMTEEDKAFIDDDYEDEDTREWQEELRAIIKYDPSKYQDEGEAQVSDFSKQTFEERMSGLLAMEEDRRELALLKAEKEAEKELEGDRFDAGEEDDDEEEEEEEEEAFHVQDDEAD